MKNYLYFLLCLLLFSCEKKGENPFIGNWYTDLNIENDNDENFGLNIINDSLLEYKFGFYDDIDFKKKIITNSHDTIEMNTSVLKFLGTKTKYKIEDSTLLIKEINYNHWTSYKIKFLDEEKLILEDEYKKKYTLVKKTNLYKDSTLYDAIVVDRGFCLGSCGVNSTYINRKGEIYFKGSGFNTNEDHFIAKLDLKIIKPIFEKFDQIDVFKMNNSYQRYVTDAQNNTITFIKNGKIVKTIQDYARKAPIDFYAAYNELSYLFQKVTHYDTITFIFDNRVHFPSLENKTFKHTLYNSELFLLDLELRKGKVTTTSFEPKYTLNFSYYNRGFLFHKIETDGHYYTFYYNDNTTKTIDIGYNFIKANPILTKPKRN